MREKIIVAILSMAFLLYPMAAIAQPDYNPTYDEMVAAADNLVVNPQFRVQVLSYNPAAAWA